MSPKPNTMRRLLILIFIPSLLLTISTVFGDDNTPDGYVIAMDLPLRLHRLPAMESETTMVIDPGTALTIMQRTHDSEWLDVRSPDGDEGWMMTEFADVLIDLDGVSILTDVNDLPHEDIEFPPAVVKRIRKIFEDGQTMGNRADVFSKVGDSITAAPHFLNPIGDGLYNLGDYQYLQGVIDHFSATAARGDNLSFNNLSVAAGVGWPAHAAIDSKFADPSLCETDESPLACEYRLVHPAMALIMFGTNDVSRFDADVYKGNLQQIVQTSITMGVIPIISTIPNRLGFEDKVNDFNKVIADTADRFSIPLWHFNGAMQTLPDDGLTVDGTHPSIPPHGEQGSADFRADNLYYGYVIRNLTALQMLDAVWRTLDSEKS